MYRNYLLHKYLNTARVKSTFFKNSFHHFTETHNLIKIKKKIINFFGKSALYWGN